MFNRVLLFIILSMQLPTFAEGISATTNGVYLVIDGAGHIPTGSPTNELIRFDQRLVWMTFCDTGKVILSYPDARYGIRIKMKNADGKEISKTKFGKQWFGSNFDDLHKITDSIVGNTTAWGSYKDNLGLGGALFLPKPVELFQIQEPGVYTM
jgi:hypothetical protein